MDERQSDTAAVYRNRFHATILLQSYPYLVQVRWRKMQGWDRARAVTSLIGCALQIGRRRVQSLRSVALTIAIHSRHSGEHAEESDPRAHGLVVPRTNLARHPVTLSSVAAQLS